LYEGTGLCAQSESSAAGDCTLGGTQSGVARPVADVAGNTVSVCGLRGADDVSCDRGICSNPCVDDQDCGGPPLQCRADGVCVDCLDDSGCSTGSGLFTKCFDHKRCGCRSDAECADNPS